MGVVGALIMRGVMIALGAELIEAFFLGDVHPGSIHCLCGVRMLFYHKGDIHTGAKQNLSVCQQALRVSHDITGAFFRPQRGRLFATPYFSFCWWWKSPTLH